jgi:hypothetical protein
VVTHAANIYAVQFPRPTQPRRFRRIKIFVAPLNLVGHLLVPQTLAARLGAAPPVQATTLIGHQLATSCDRNRNAWVRARSDSSASSRRLPSLWATSRSVGRVLYGTKKLPGY